MKGTDSCEVRVEYEEYMDDDEKCSDTPWLALLLWPVKETCFKMSDSFSMSYDCNKDKMEYNAYSDTDDCEDYSEKDDGIMWETMNCKDLTSVTVKCNDAASMSVGGLSLVAVLSLAWGVAVW